MLEVVRTGDMNDGSENSKNECVSCGWLSGNSVDLELVREALIHIRNRMGTAWTMCVVMSNT